MVSVSGRIVQQLVSPYENGTDTAQLKTTRKSIKGASLHDPTFFASKVDCADISAPELITSTAVTGRPRCITKPFSFGYYRKQICFPPSRTQRNVQQAHTNNRSSQVLVCEHEEFLLLSYVRHTTQLNPSNYIRLRPLANSTPISYVRLFRLHAPVAPNFCYRSFCCQHTPPQTHISCLTLFLASSV
jgi:hypothetical protein